MSGPETPSGYNYERDGNEEEKYNKQLDELEAKESLDDITAANLKKLMTGKSNEAYILAETILLFPELDEYGIVSEFSQKVSVKTQRQFKDIMEQIKLAIEINSSIRFARTLNLAQVRSKLPEVLQKMRGS